MKCCSILAKRCCAHLLRNNVPTNLMEMLNLFAPQRMRRYHYVVFLSLFFLFFASNRLKSNINSDLLLLQAEYALMEKDTAQAEMIYHYLLKQKEGKRVSQLCQLRLITLQYPVTKKTLLSIEGEEFDLLKQLMEHQNKWKNDHATSKFPSIFLDEKIKQAFENLQLLIDETMLCSSIFMTKEMAFLQKLVDTSKRFYQTSLKQCSESKRGDKLAVQLIAILYNEMLNRLFVNAITDEETPKNNYYFDYQKHCNLLVVNNLKNCFFHGEYRGESSSLWQEQLVKCYDIHFFLLGQIVQKGLMDAKRKNQLHHQFDTPEQALLFYHKMHQTKPNEKWMKKIIVAMEGTKATQLSIKSKYYQSNHLLKDLSRELIAQLDEEEAVPIFFNNQEGQEAFIKQQIRRSKFKNYFYTIHQQQTSSIEKATLPKLNQFCQKTKTGKSTILNFFDGKQYIFVLLINDEKQLLHYVAKSEKIKDALTLLKYNYGNPAAALNANRNTLTQFQHAGNVIYHSIIQPLFENEIPKDLVIVPDGLLNYIPFEALSLKPVKQTVNYLVEHTAIRYYPSLKWLLKSERPKNKTIAISNLTIEAPYYRDEDPSISKNLNVSNLLGSQQEVESIENIFPIAKRQPFSTKLTPKRSKELVHFSMHAASSFKHQAEPGLIFSNQQKDILYLHELGLLPEVPPVVVLSACDTGIGKYTAGEGLRSIGQQFLSVGAQSVIQNLNKVNDHSSAQLMGTFYKAMKRQVISTSALQQSKLTYLKNADAFYAHPYFWSGLVTYGQPFVIEQ